MDTLSNQFPTQEDEILRRLYEIEKIHKWSEVSRRMCQDFKLEGRSGKQCRERYHNHLKGGIRKEKWSQEEEDLLVALHAELGNRWAHISKLIPGRTENCVKNMLYSRMRKSVRLLNRFVHHRFRRELKSIKISFINRLIEMTQSGYKRAESQRSEQELRAINIKNLILSLDIPEDLDASEEQALNAKQLALKIQDFKRVNQKHQRGIALAKIKKLKMKKKQLEDSDPEEFLQEKEQSPGKQSKTSRRRPQRVARKKTIKLIKKQDEQDSSVEPELNEVKIEEEEYDLPEIKPIQKGPSTIGSCEIDKKEQNPYRRSRVSVMRADSLDHPFLTLLEEAGLEKPIQIEDYMHNITPTPKFSQIMDWMDATNGWRLPFLSQ